MGALSTWPALSAWPALSTWLRGGVVVALACAAVGVTARVSAGEKVELDPQITYAPSWEAAVEEAKLLNVPIVVHSHGFYCPPCWGLHQSICKNKKYIEFAEKSTVEVICLSSLQEGIDKKDHKAETYEAEVGGKKVQCLIEFPGMTIAQMLAMHASKGGQYNNTGKVPYTCIVDPHTLEEIQHWQGGGVSQDALAEAVTEVRKALVEKHGKGIARKDIRTIDAGQEKIEGLVAKQDFATAIAEVKRLEAKAKDFPETLWKRITELRNGVDKNATEALAQVETDSANDLPAARKALSALLPRLKGTSQEARAKQLQVDWAKAAKPATSGT
jgi:hypothetical protein